MFFKANFHQKPKFIVGFFLLFSLFQSVFTVQLHAQEDTTKLKLALEHHPTKDSTRVTILIKLCQSLKFTRSRKAVYFGELALREAKDLKNGYLIYGSSSMLAVAHIYNNQLNEAYQVLLPALKLEPKLPLLKRREILTNRNTISHTLVSVNPYKSIFYLKQAFDIAAKDSADYNFMGLFAQNIGSTFDESFNKPDSALVYYKRAKECFKNQKHTSSEDIFFINSAISNAYINLNQIDSAFFELKEAQKYAKGIDNPYYLTSFYRLWAQVYQRKGQLNLALDNARKSLNYLKQYEGNITLINTQNAYSLLSEIFQAQSRWDSAYHYQGILSQLKDSIYQANQTKVLKELETKYRVKEEKQQNKLLKAENEKITLRQNILTVVLSGFVLIVLITWYFYRRVSLQKQKIELQGLELSALNSKLNNALLEVAELTEHKRKIISLLAHDLRNPLQIIQLKASILSLQDPDSSIAEDFKRAAEQIHLTTLQIVEVENEKQIAIQDSLRTIDLDVAVTASIQRLKSIADSKGVVFDFELNDLNEGKIIAEPNLIEHILDNILSNAIKFSPTQYAIRIQSIVAQNYVRLFIQDQGAGMDESRKQTLFQSNAPNLINSESGLGIGLSLVKHYIELMGGKINLESTEGVGTCVVLQFLKASY